MRDSRSLARGLRTGDPHAAATVRARIQKILAFRGFGIPSEDRRDLEQTIMLQLWQAVGKPGFEADKLWGFVEIVTSRRCIDWLRTHRSQSFELSETLPDPSADPAAKAILKERVALAHEALQALPEPCRELIDLHIAQGRPYREIAAMLGVSDGALRVRMTRCVGQAAAIVRRLQSPERDQ